MKEMLSWITNQIPQTTANVYTSLRSSQLRGTSITVLLMGKAAFLINGIAYLFTLQSGGYSFYLLIGYGFWCGIFVSIRM